jgi:hypothetical protein
MGFKALRCAWYAAGFAAVAAAALAGCGAAPGTAASGSTASTAGTASPASTAPSSAAASKSPAASGGGTTGATSAVTLAARSAATATSVSGTVSVQASANGTAAAGTPSGTSGAASIAGTFTERLRPSVEASADLSWVSAGGKALPGGISEVFTPTTVYIKAPALTKQLHQSKPWVSVSVATLTHGALANLGQTLSSPSDNGPLTEAQLLNGATTVHQAGATTLNGVKVTEYTGTINLAKAAASMTGSSRSTLEQQIKAAGLTTATFTVWVDGQHVARKAVINEDGKTFKETVTTTITTVNQPVNISVPPASQTTPVPASGSTATS